MSSKPGRVVVSPSDFTYPKSQFEGWSPPAPVNREITALLALLAEQDAQKDNPDDDYMVFELEEFSIYRTKSSPRVANELEPLTILRAQRGVCALLFDGTLTCGNVRRYVQAVEFGTLSNEWKPDSAVPSLTTYIQSPLGEQRKIWYRLGTPAPEYRRYHEPFLWVAMFGLHFVDFLNEHLNARLEDFRQRFYDWLRQRYEAGISGWLAKYNRTDFRHAVSAYVEYLYNESYLFNSDFGDEHIWKQVHPSALSDMKTWKQKASETVCTPHVYNCFKGSYFKDHLAMREPAPKIAAAQEQRKLELRFIEHPVNSRQVNPTPFSPDGWEPSKGDFVSTSRDVGGCWKKSTAATWFAFVQDTHRNRQGELLLSVIWLYRPEDTTIGSAYYPHPNELFYSDHCNCNEWNFKASDVLGKVEVCWCPKTTPPEEVIYISQKYCTKTEAILTLKHSDRACSCHERSQTAFEKVAATKKPGDTVYFLEKKSQSRSGQDILEPAVIESLDPWKEEIKLRRLLRRGRDCFSLEDVPTTVQPNELVLTNDTFTVRADRITDHRCNIRFFDEEDKIPHPYDRNGVADCWYIRTFVSGGRLQPIGEIKRIPSLNEGFDPRAAKTILQGLSIFSGGGSFDRALEECGAVKFILGVDIFSAGMHTWKANLQQGPDSANTYCGSVDDHLSAILRGDQKVYSLLKIGQLTFICGGSPCQGYSKMNGRKSGEPSLCNASHVTTIASYIDLYRPLYAILENVPALAERVSKKIDEYPFAQLIACLVSMGYQVQQFKLDAWSHSSSQQRPRLFLSVAAPGLRPLPPPISTHAHPSNVKNRSIGKLPNGEAFGEREFRVTPFEHTTAQAASKDLPAIGDSRVQMCIPFPDHLCARAQTHFRRSLIALIPKYPPGQTFANLMYPRNGGKVCIPQVYIDMYKKWGERRRTPSAKCWGRMRAEALFPLITTSMDPGCAFGGHILHWHEDRAITLQEARRAQGFPDDVVLIGSLADKFKIVGNAVDYSLGLTLGYSLMQCLPPSENDLGLDNGRDEMHVVQEYDDLEQGLRTVTENISMNITRVQRSTTTKTIIDLTTNTTVDIRSQMSSRPAATSDESSQDRTKSSQKTPQSIANRKRLVSKASDDEAPKKRTRNTGDDALKSPRDWSRRPESLAKGKRRITDFFLRGHDEDEDDEPIRPPGRHKLSGHWSSNTE